VRVKNSVFCVHDGACGTTPHGSYCIAVAAATPTATKVVVAVAGLKEVVVW
jgi:hypothetical protein